MFAFRQLKFLVSTARSIRYIPLVLAIGVFLSVFTAFPVKAEGARADPASEDLGSADDSQSSGR